MMTEKSFCQDKEAAMRRIPLFHAWWFAIGSFILVDALNTTLDQVTHSPAGDYLGITFLGLYGVYCLQNYLGCLEIHCAITGPGFLLAAGLMVLRVVGIFDQGIGFPYLVAFIAAFVGFCLEWIYAQRTGSHFLARK
jgi:hypothetical protein